MIEYVVNHASRIIHLRVDGASQEQCNLDQIRRREVIDEDPNGGTLAALTQAGLVPCRRCFPEP